MRIYWFFVWKNLNPCHPRMLVPRLVEMAQWFRRRGFFNFVNVFSLFRNYLPLKKGGGLHLNKLESSSPKDAFCQVWMKLAQWFWRRRFSYFVNVFSLFRNYLPLENKLESLSPKDALFKFGWNWPSGFGEEDFLISSMYFRYFINISPWKGTGPFIWTNLNPLDPRMIFAKFGWNWLFGSGEEDF